MTLNEIIKRLIALKTCMECEISGSSCDVNCKWQYEAGNMGEIVQTLKRTIEAIEEYKSLLKQMKIVSTALSGITYHEGSSYGFDEACTIADRWAEDKNEHLH